MKPNFLIIIFVMSQCFICFSLTKSLCGEVKSYLGCFNNPYPFDGLGNGLTQDMADKVNAGNLTFKYYIYQPGKMTIEYCGNVCIMFNFQFTGLAFGDYCACGNTVKYTKTSETFCNHTCSGNINETCGGYDTATVSYLSVYANRC